MAKNQDFMVATIKVAIPAPTTLHALGKLAAEYDAELGKFRTWVEGQAGEVKASEPVAVPRRVPGEAGT